MRARGRQSFAALVTCELNSPSERESRMTQIKRLSFLPSILLAPATLKRWTHAKAFCFGAKELIYTQTTGPQETAKSAGTVEKCNMVSCNCWNADAVRLFLSSTAQNKHFAAMSAQHIMPLVGVVWQTDTAQQTPKTTACESLTAVCFRIERRYANATFRPAD